MMAAIFHRHNCVGRAVILKKSAKTSSSNLEIPLYSMNTNTLNALDIN